MEIKVLVGYFLNIELSVFMIVVSDWGKLVIVIVMVNFVNY